MVRQRHVDHLRGDAVELEQAEELGVDRVGEPAEAVVDVVHVAVDLDVDGVRVPAERVAALEQRHLVVRIE